ncbi:MAG: fatty acid--CoA ligase family protein [Ginsengibacter sp.]
MEEVKIFDLIQEYGNSEAIVHNNKTFTYFDLVRKIKFWDEELRYIRSENVIGIEGDFSLDSIALIFSLLKKSCIIVPLDIKQKDKNSEKYNIAELNYLVGIPAREEFQINHITDHKSDNFFYNRLFEINRPGLVLFTSGSSGIPKAAVHDFFKLLKKFNKKRRTFVTINFLLFDHWGGLNTMFHILSNGGLLVLLEERSPDYVCELIDKYQVELLPASPTFLNMLILSRAYKRWSLKSLKLITYGAEPMPGSLLQLVNNIFPNVNLQQTYGLIELGVLSSKSEGNNSLWVKIGGDGYALRVVDGLLEIKSDSAMLGYINAPSPYTEDGWFKTGDAVEVNGDYFKILGRKSELINVGGEKVFPQEVENVILELEEVRDVIVFGEKNPLTGSIVCAKVSISSGESPHEIIKLIKIHCRNKLASFKVPVKVTVETGIAGFENTRFKKERMKWI